VLALKSDGTVLAWGDNASGERGRGTFTLVGGPAPVTGLASVT
jgi:alpha-tubulin suppressor-like RCC1 family protein